MSYGGPHSQLVKNTWLGELRRWEMVMAQKGYIVYVQDNRGTQNRGAEFEKAIYGQCGQAEMADQMEGVRMLCGLPYVDRDSHRRPRLELRRVHDDIACHELSRRVQGGRGRRARDRLEMVRGDVR